MRKLLLALPLVASASWAGTTYYAGSQTQPAYDKLISQLNEFKPFTVESEQYNAGFLTSTAITKVMNSNGPGAKTLFRLQHVIEHSQVGVDGNGARIGASTIHTTLIVDEHSQEAMKVMAAFNNQQPIELFTRVGISGQVTNDLVMNPFSINQQGTQASFEGGRYTINSNESGAINGSGTMGAIVLTEDEVEYSVAASEGKFDLQRLSTGIHSGSYSFDIPQIEILAKAAGMDIGLADIKIASDSIFENELMQSNVLVEIGAIDSPLDLDSASYEFEFGGLSMQAMQGYVENMQNVALVGAEPAEMDSMVTSAMAGYKALISRGANIGINLAMSNSGGAIETSFDATFKGDGSVSGYDSIATMRDLANALALRLQLNADEAALNATPAAMLLMHPMAQDYLVYDGFSYAADIKASELILDVNGNPQSLEDMLGGMLEMPLDMSMLSGF